MSAALAAAMVDREAGLVPAFLLPEEIVPDWPVKCRPDVAD